MDVVRPRIGLTRGDTPPSKYHRALLTVGADVIEFHAASAEGRFATWAPGTALAHLDGLMLSGGGDVAPDLYGESDVHPTVFVDPSRDRLELALCTAALIRGVPILGVCRGMQVLNVSAGGTLWQDLHALRPGTAAHSEPIGTRDRRRRLHTIKTTAGTLMERLLGGAPVAVNSIHHQAVRSPAPGLRISALAPDGVVEAVEAIGAPFVVGVQWHPEEIWEEDARHAVLFSSFYYAARERV